MNDKERRQWVMNAEGLYNWWISSHMGLYSFVRKNRKEITEIIEKAIGPKKEEWQKNYWGV